LGFFFFFSIGFILNSFHFPTTSAESVLCAKMDNLGPDGLYVNPVFGHGLNCNPLGESLFPPSK